MSRTPYDEFMELILKSQSIVAITGAGISTSTGIPDFRSDKGIYVDPSVDGERVFDINVFKTEPKIFANFFSKLYPLIKNASPSKGHMMLKKLEDMGKLKTIITQNIDSLHQQAGNTDVLEVHGHAREYVCIKSMHHRVPIEDIEKSIADCEPIVCSECGEYMKPDIVFFGEHVKDLEKVLAKIQKADLVFIIGTSLSVYPVAGLPDYCSDNTKIVILNKTETPYDQKASLVFHDDIDTFAMKMGLAQ